jgi:hypothetical protein
MNNSQKFTGWRSPRRLAQLGEFYEAVKAAPESVSDVEFIHRITQVFWPTNCWAYVEQAFAIIAPGCAMRPHLVRQLVVHPIEAMVAGGLEDENDVIAQGLAYANKVRPYVDPSPDGRQWLLERWPMFEDVVIELFRHKYHEALK